MVEPLYPLRCLLAQAAQHLWLVDFDDVYREFTCVHHTIQPAPSPPDAGRDTVPSRFGCQSGDCGSRVRRLCTGRYLPAHLRRILLMEQQVWSIQRARQSTLRPRVAATTKSDGMWCFPLCRRLPYVLSASGSMVRLGQDRLRRCTGV